MFRTSRTSNVPMKKYFVYKNDHTILRCRNYGIDVLNEGSVFSNGEDREVTFTLYVIKISIRH